MATYIMAFIKASPIAGALLAMYWMGNSFWGEMMKQQLQVNEKMATSMERLAKEFADLHAHLNHVEVSK